MTDKQMILAYIDEINDKGGDVPYFFDDPFPMQVAKLDNALRKCS